MGCVDEKHSTDEEEGTGAKSLHQRSVRPDECVSINLYHWVVGTKMLIRKGKVKTRKRGQQFSAIRVQKESHAFGSTQNREKKNNFIMAGTEGEALAKDTPVPFGDEEKGKNMKDRQKNQAYTGDRQA